MAAIHVTRAEFEAPQKRVQEVEGNAVSIGEQFEKFVDGHTEVANIVKMHEEFNREISEKIRQLDGMQI